MMKYNKEPYCRLANGQIEPLYYNNDYKEPRAFYKENGRWYLEHDEFRGNAICLCVHEIVEFLTTEEMKKL